MEAKPCADEVQKRIQDLEGALEHWKRKSEGHAVKATSLQAMLEAADGIIDKLIEALKDR